MVYRRVDINIPKMGWVTEGNIFYVDMPVDSIVEEIELGAEVVKYTFPEDQLNDLEKLEYVEIKLEPKNIRFETNVAQENDLSFAVIFDFSTYIDREPVNIYVDPKDFINTGVLHVLNSVAQAFGLYIAYDEENNILRPAKINHRKSEDPTTTASYIAVNRYLSGNIDSIVNIVNK